MLTAAAAAAPTPRVSARVREPPRRTARLVVVLVAALLPNPPPHLLPPLSPLRPLPPPKTLPRRPPAMSTAARLSTPRVRRMSVMVRANSSSAVSASAAQTVPAAAVLVHQVSARAQAHRRRPARRDAASSRTRSYSGFKEREGRIHMAGVSRVI
jgi:hypothetical protein